MSNVGQPKQHVPIFVGSTYEDLIEYRNAVKEALHHLETIVRGMEYFGSKPGTPKDECLKAVRSCRVYVGIFAMRYGSIDEETGKSMTQLEYEEAAKLKLPTLIYLIDEQKQPILPTFVETGPKAEQLTALKDELKKKFMVSFFTSPEDLARRITQDLPPILHDIGVTITDDQLIPAVEDAKALIQRFHARPLKHAGKEVIIDVEIQDEPQGLDADECEALGLPLGDAIERRVKSPLLGDYRRVMATGDMADWLESVPGGTKAQLKIRLVFGKSEDVDYGPEGPVTKVKTHRGYRVVSVLEERPADETHEKTA